MSTIETLLQKIKTSIYGKDVRDAIHDAIEECYDDVSTAKTLADDATEAANDAAEAATEAAEAANTAATKAVRYDSAQSLTATQKAQARSNIGAVAIGEAVRYDAAQLLTDGQKGQARANINVPNADTALDLSIEHVTQLTEATDYDDLTTVGSYRVQSAAYAALMTNCPTTRSHRLIVMSPGSSALKQQIVIDFGNKIHMRTHDNDPEGWSDWVTVANLGRVMPITHADSIAITDYTDYNDLTSLGRYYANFGTSGIDKTTLSNCPSGYSHFMTVTNGSYSTNYRQTIVDNRNNIYTRRYDANAGEWDEWHRFAMSGEEEESLEDIRTYSPAGVNELVTIAETYYDHRDSLRYVNGSQYSALRNYDGGNQIDCSTFVGLVLMGVDYDHSPYNGVPLAVGPYDWAFDLFESEIDRAGEICRLLTFAGCRLKWTPRPYDSTATPKTSAEIATALKAAGVRKGDILFTANSYSDRAYKGITHVSIVRTDNLDAEYPLIESNAAAGNDKAIWHKTLATGAQFIQAICRPITTKNAYRNYTDAMDEFDETLRLDTEGENLVPYPYASSESYDGNNTIVSNGVTFAEMPDSSIGFYGTAGEGQTVMFDVARRQQQTIKLKRDTRYTFAGCPAWGSSKTYYAHLRAYIGYTEVWSKQDVGWGITFSTREITAPGDIYLDIRFVVCPETEIPNELYFKPMLTEGTRFSAFQDPKESNAHLKVKVDTMLSIVETAFTDLKAAISDNPTAVAVLDAALLDLSTLE